MKLRSHLQAVLRNLLHKRRVEGELDEEVRTFTEMLADEKVAAGMPPCEAQRTAQADCGGIEQIKQAVRDRRAGVRFEILGQDLRYGRANCAGAQPSPLSPSLRLRSASEQTLPSSVS